MKPLIEEKMQTKKSKEEILNNFYEKLNRYVKPKLFEFNPDKHAFKTSEETEVVPHQSLTIRQLLEKHRTGMLGDISKNPVYLENQDFDSENILTKQDFDLTDIDEHREKVNQKKERLETFKKLKEKKAKAEKEETASKNPLESEQQKVVT